MKHALLFALAFIIVLASLTQIKPAYALSLIQTSTVANYALVNNEIWAVGIVQAPNGDVLCAYEDNTYETSSNGVIDMKRSTDNGSTWDNGVVIDTPGVRDCEPQFLVVGSRIYFFETTAAWNILLRSSDDNGHTWSSPRTIWSAYGQTWAASDPIVSNGRWVLAICTLSSSSVIYSDDNGQTWSQGGTVSRTGLALLEPTIAQLSDGSLIMFCRNYAGGMYQYVSMSSNNGASWTDAVPGPNSPSAMAQVKKLYSGKLALVWDNVQSSGNDPRYPLVIALTTDGHSFSEELSLGSGSNHGLCQLNDGTILVAYAPDSPFMGQKILCARISGESGPGPSPSPPPTSYSVTIGSTGIINVQMTFDGTDFTTPHPESGLTGTHTVVAPMNPNDGWKFQQWSTGSTDTTLTISNEGTYTADYQIEQAGTGKVRVTAKYNDIYVSITAFITGSPEGWVITPPLGRLFTNVAVGLQTVTAVYQGQNQTMNTTVIAFFTSNAPFDFGGGNDGDNDGWPIPYEYVFGIGVVGGLGCLVVAARARGNGKDLSSKRKRK